jgi:hypothetical protein
MLSPIACGSPAPAPTEQIDVRAEVSERITRGVNAINPGNRVKDEWFLQKTWHASSKVRRGERG